MVGAKVLNYPVFVCLRGGRCNFFLNDIDQMRRQSGCRQSRVNCFGMKFHVYPMKAHTGWHDRLIGCIKIGTGNRNIL